MEGFCQTLGPRQFPWDFNTHCLYDTRRRLHHAEGRQDQDSDLPSEWCVESACLGLAIFRGRDVWVPRKPSWHFDDRRIRIERRRTAGKAIAYPAKPAPEMIAAHEVSHLPFRSWCSHCVRGRGKLFQHRRVQHDQDDEAHPVVSLDYAEQGDWQCKNAGARGQKQVSQNIFYLQKGIEHFYPEAALLRDIRFLGYAQLTLKSDQEPAILTLTIAVKNTLSARGVTCPLENSPKGDAHGMSNGESESSVAIAQGLARTLKDHVEFKTEKMINPKSPLLPWLVEYVGILYTLFSFDERSKNGMMPFRKLKGRDWVMSSIIWRVC